MCFVQALLQSGYFARPEMQAGPLASPPRKINRARRQVVFKLCASVLIKAGLTTLAVTSLGEMMEAFPLLRWLHTFSFMSQFPCAEAVAKAGWYCLSAFL